METAEALKKSRRTELFKSYYVVWKLFRNILKMNISASLNRTM